MNVLDPFEVKEIEVWPLWDLPNDRSALAQLCAAEYAVYARVLKDSMFNAVLNEKVIVAPTAPNSNCRSHIEAASFQTT